MKQAKILIASLALAAGTAGAQHAGHAGHADHSMHAQPRPGPAAPSPYAGLQSREIKALSPEDTRMLLEGHGMRLALPAELNGYPGPSHVLELAEHLQLGASQREGTQALMDAHKAAARALGARVVEAERALDRAFAGGQASADDVARLTREAGQLQAELRAEHLRTHLAQRALLTPHQVAQYQRLRGYTTASTDQGVRP